MHGSAARVLLVEDDPPAARLLEIALTTEGYEVCLADDAAAGAKAVETFRPDLVILDVGLGDGEDGVSLARRLRRASDLPIMFLTGHADPEERVEGLRAGADDYLAKPCSLPELLLRVQSLLRRTGRLASGVHQVGPLVIDELAHLVVVGDEAVALTPTEFKILLALARSPGQVLSKAQLLAEAWGFDAFDGNLVEVHVSSLRKKLERHGPRLLHTVRGVGYVVRP